MDLSVDSELDADVAPRSNEEARGAGIVAHMQRAGAGSIEGLRLPSGKDSIFRKKSGRTRADQRAGGQRVGVGIRPSYMLERELNAKDPGLTPGAEKGGASHGMMLQVENAIVIEVEVVVMVRAALKLWSRRRPAG